MLLGSILESFVFMFATIHLYHLTTCEDGNADGESPNRRDVRLVNNQVRRHDHSNLAARPLAATGCGSI